MSEFKCKFCGSDKLRVPRISEYGPEIELKETGDYGPVEDFCCGAQKKNAEYIAKNYDPDSRPDPDDVSKW